MGVLTAEDLRAAGPMVKLSELLGRVPGIVANNRSTYAQDLQINWRGFGARASFGVRGLQLYSDGIPASGPDGRGQVSHFDLAGATRLWARNRSVAGALDRQPTSRQDHRGDPGGAGDGSHLELKDRASAGARVVLSVPIPLRRLPATQPYPVRLVLLVVHRVIVDHLLGRAALEAGEAGSGCRQ